MPCPEGDRALQHDCRGRKYLNTGGRKLNMYPSAKQALKKPPIVSSTHGHHHWLHSAERMFRAKPLGSNLVLPLQLPDGFAPWLCHTEVGEEEDRRSIWCQLHVELSNHQSAAHFQNIADTRTPLNKVLPVLIQRQAESCTLILVL